MIDVDLSLRKGETLAVVGESGSGKSSLVRAILGLIPMHSGRVVYAGEALDGPVETRSIAQKRDFQLVYQDPVAALNPQMRVQSIVGEPLSVHEPSLSSQERIARVITMLQKVGLDDNYLRRYPHQLSGGQAQRVADLELELATLRSFPLSDFGGRPIAAGALVTIEDEDEQTRVVLLVPSSGGLTIDTQGQRVQLITPASPLGQALIGREVGDEFSLALRRAHRDYTIVDAT